nr:GDSL esterase/lipase LTL1-like [Physcomitrium patens]|eukprot:XP_024363841.1 GDSL esterase/lipase LTL1-like [Physcomitrella patens]
MRKFIISNIGLIGCASSVLSQRSKTGECTEEVNNYAIGFNVALKPRLESLGAELSNSIFLYTNAYDVLKAIIDKPLQHDKSKKFKTGFTDLVSTACCGVGRYNGIDGACSTISRLCPDRTKSMFGDDFHPTEKVNKICNNQFIFGGLHAICSMNVK